jgi:uncharacterized protein YggU (UPF0235/DUF167 family)
VKFHSVDACMTTYIHAFAHRIHISVNVHPSSSRNGIDKIREDGLHKNC